MSRKIRHRAAHYAWHLTECALICIAVHIIMEAL